MLNYWIYAMIYLGSGLMVYNIYGFIRFGRFIRGKEYQGKNDIVLNLPVVLLVMFLLGYLAVGIFGHPDLIVSGILFGGSIFVFIMHLLLDRITHHIVKKEQAQSRLMAEKESHRAKIEFLSTVSHEMRTPMNIIMGSDAVALNDPDLHPKTREQLKNIDLSARHLLGLINNILDINRIQQGRLMAKEAAFSMGDMLKQICLVAACKCEEKKLTYIFNEPEDLPGCFTGDETMLK